MRRRFTYCFNRSGFEELANRQGQPLELVWGRRFGPVRPGDLIYVVAVRSGALALVCRFEAMSVDLVAGRMRGHNGTPITVDRTISHALTRSLRFETSRGAVPLRFLRPGVLDPQTIRGVRQLTETSARFLDQLLDGGVHAGGTRVGNVDPRGLRALSVRQPWAELILRGIKTVEVRSRPTNVRERILIYASSVRFEPQIEERIERDHGIAVDDLPRGVLVGTVEIVDCRPLKKSDATAAGFTIHSAKGLFGWRLAAPERETELRRPANKPQPVWFYPF